MNTYLNIKRIQILNINAMTPSKKTRKAVDWLLTISFAIVLITGIMLHLKAHGILI